MSNTLSLKPGTRLRTGGTTYEVTEDAHVPAGVVPVVPQPARLLKVFCSSCGYTCRITQRWITKAGTPECPSGHGHMVVEEKAEKAPKPKAAPLPEPTPVERNPEPEPVSVVEEALADLPQQPETVTEAINSALAELLAQI